MSNQFNDGENTDNNHYTNSETASRRADGRRKSNPEVEKWTKEALARNGIVFDSNPVRNKSTNKTDPYSSQKTASRSQSSYLDEYDLDNDDGYDNYQRDSSGRRRKKKDDKEDLDKGNKNKKREDLEKFEKSLDKKDSAPPTAPGGVPSEAGAAVEDVTGTIASDAASGAVAGAEGAAGGTVAGGTATATGAGATAAGSAGGTAVGTGVVAGGTEAGAAVGGSAAAGPAAPAILAAVAVAMAARDAYKKALEKVIGEEEAKRREEEKKEKKKERRWIFLIIRCAILMIPTILAGPIYVVSEESTVALEQIIENREKRYTEDLKKNADAASISNKTLMMFTNEEYEELLFKNYDQIEGTDPAVYEDPCYRELVKNEYGTDIVNFFGKNEELNEEDVYEVPVQVVGTLLKSEMENFNKIKWTVSSTNGNYSYNRNLNFSSTSDLEANDVKPSRSGSYSTNELGDGDLQKIPYTELKIPKLSKYDIDPETSDEVQKGYTYAQAAEPYVQKWFIPYTMMIDTQDKNFIVNEVMGKMYHPIDFTLFEINRELKTTTTTYYLEVDRKEVWVEYTENVTTNADGSQSTEKVSTEKNVENDLGKSNTKEHPVGEKNLGGSRTTGSTWVNDDGSVTTSYKVVKNHKIITTLTDGGKIATDENGPMIKNINVKRDIYPYRYIPKITHAEAFYEIITAEYTVNPIDENNAPVTSEESELQVASNSQSGDIVVKQTWEERLTAGTYTTEEYKVSYYSDADLEKLNKKVSRVEWYQDWGDTASVTEAINTGNMYDAPDAAVSSENMQKLLDQAAKMVKEKRWKYSQGGDRGVCTTLEQLYSKKNIDCSAFVSSLYNIFLGVNPGSWTGDMIDTNPGFEAFSFSYSDLSGLQPGDILWREGHVGLYIGNGKQIDAGGPGYEPCSGDLPGGSWKYTHFIRYTGNGADLSDVQTPDGVESGEGNTESEPSTEKGIIYPTKSMQERADAYNNYGNGKGYSYDDMYFAYYQIEKRYGELTLQNMGGYVNGLGGYMWPVQITADNPGTNVINCFFGYTPAYGRDHTGIDISRGNINYTEGSLTKGPLIVAAHDGEVTMATANPVADSDGYTYVNIQTTDATYTTQYGHLSEIYVSTGDQVKKGDVIGRMGTTGRSTGVHLHFSVSDSSGNEVEPLTFYNFAKESEPDKILDASILTQDFLNTITSLPTGYIYHSEKAGGLSKLRDYIRGWEYSGTPPMNDAKTHYKIYDDGKGHETVGYGVDIFNGGFAEAFRAAGYPTSMGGYVPIEFVDSLEEQEVLECLEYIQSKTEGLGLKEHQLHALVSRAYNCGKAGALGERNGKTFVEAYKAYWKESDDLYGQPNANMNHPLFTNYMSKPNTSEGEVLDGLVTRRKKEWWLFQTGNYDNKY